MEVLCQSTTSTDMTSSSPLSLRTMSVRWAKGHARDTYRWYQPDSALNPLLPSAESGQQKVYLTMRGGSSQMVKDLLWLESYGKTSSQFQVDQRPKLWYQWPYNSYPGRPYMRTSKWMNGNSITHSHSLHWLLFEVPQCTRKTSSVTFGIREENSQCVWVIVCLFFLKYNWDVGENKKCPIIICDLFASQFWGIA